MASTYSFFVVFIVKIGLVPDCLLGWQGGRDLLGMLADSMSMALEPDDEIRILSIARHDKLPWRVTRIAKHFVTRFPPDLDWAKKEVTRTSRARVIAGVVGRKFKIEILSELDAIRRADDHSPDVLGPWHGLKPHGTDVPCLGYIPDCQHRRLPSLFSRDEVADRDTLFAEMLLQFPVVIVNSEDAKHDLLRYFPSASSEIVSLPFAASPSRKWLEIDSAAACKKYRLPSRYYLCSNQFWQHKNHGVIFEALALARAEGSPTSMVFTGAMEDYRAPDYVRNLMVHVQSLGVAEDCLFLGLIPKLDQIAIMKSAIALVQPTLFEGGPGGGAVYDAISVGTPVIVSDILVNREIEKFVDAFFPPSDPVSLLKTMRIIESARKQKKPASVLLTEGRERRQQCGKVIRSAFALAIRRSAAAELNGPRKIERCAAQD